MRDKSIVPAWCPMCEGLMMGSASNTSYYKWDCCVNCFIEFIEGREEKWEAGWRPSAEQIKAFAERVSSYT
jgi:hypothetical protein